MLVAQTVATPPPSPPAIPPSQAWEMSAVIAAATITTGSTLAALAAIIRLMQRLSKTKPFRNVVPGFEFSDRQKRAFDRCLDRAVIQTGAMRALLLQLNDIGAPLAGVPLNNLTLTHQAIADGVSYVGRELDIAQNPSCINKIIDALTREAIKSRQIDDIEIAQYRGLMQELGVTFIVVHLIKINELPQAILVLHFAEWQSKAWEELTGNLVIVEQIGARIASIFSTKEEDSNWWDTLEQISSALK